MNFDAKKYFSGSKMGWGVILLFFGLLMLMYKQDFFQGSSIYSPKYFPAYAGLIFLLTRNLWSAAVAFLIAALINLGSVVSTFKTYSDFVLPGILVIAGLIIIFYNYTKR
ncbi:MAG: hypothetical protein K6G31_14065 [Paludibacteraceae bacterium]|nr:hypothetical protein [Paludibacteraceae bacterium]